MSNCFSSPDENKDEQVYKPAQTRGCTDVFWLIVYVVFWLFMVRLQSLMSSLINGHILINISHYFYIYCSDR